MDKEINLANFEKNPETEEKEKIGIIEKSSLNSDDKLCLTLLLLDKKEAVFLGDREIIRKKRDEEGIIEKMKKELEETKVVLEKLGLNYRSSNIELKDAIAGFSVEVAKEKEILNEFTKACDEEDDQKIGNLLGYPKTAVESYNTKEALDFEIFFKKELSEEERKKLKESEILNFIGFQPSRKHWKEELEEVKKDQEIVKEKAPCLYEEIVSLGTES